MIPVPVRDFCYRAKCGCRVVFPNEPGKKLPAIDACSDHRQDMLGCHEVIQDANMARRGIEKTPTTKTRARKKN